MGGSISPTLANIFLCHHEENWINNCPPEFKPVFYRRYADDTFVLFKNPLHIQPFLQYLNNQHSRMEFTVDSERNNSIAFLDVNVVKHNDRFTTNLYRKPTFTGLGCKYDSAISEVYKTGLITCLIDRAYKISSTYQTFCSELERLRKYFSQNNYPIEVIENSIRHKLNRIFSPAPAVSTVAKQEFYLKIPFMCPETNLSITKDIQDLIAKFYPQLCLKIIFVNNFSVSSFFNYKDRVPPLVTSNIVYQYICPQCSETYVGETSRHLETRISEHRSVSSRTSLPLAKPKSNIYSHFLNTAYVINRSSFKIIECIYIHKLKPSINGIQYSNPLQILR